MENFKNNFVASLIKKHMINNSTFIFSHVKTINGKYDEENQLFLDDDGNYFHSLNKLDNEVLNSEYFFADPIQMYKLKKDTNSKDKLSDMIKNYNYNHINSLYFLKINEDGIYKILSFSSDDLEELLNNLLLTITNPNQELFEVGDEDEESLKEVYEEELREIQSGVIFGDYSLEELKELRDCIVHIKDILEDLDNTVDLQIEVVEKGNKKVKQNKKEKPKVIKNTENIPKTINIKELFNNVTKTLKAQDDAARRLILEIARMNIEGHEKNGVLLTGSTGVGKTKLVNLISKYLDRPVLIIDSTQLTAPGYVGKDIEEYLWDLYINCGKDINKAENAIVFFDEIDKKGSPSKSDISGKAVLNVLLKFLDGTEYDISENKKLVGGKDKISTKNMIVIAGGAFSDVYEEKKNSIGFNESNDQEKEISQEDFIERAMMPREFMARFPVSIHLNDLTRDDLAKILVSSDESPIKNEQDTLKKLGVKLTYTSDYIDKVIDKAILKRTGARSLKSIVSNSTWQVYEEVLNNPNKYAEVIIDGNIVDDTSKFQLVKRR